MTDAVTIKMTLEITPADAAFMDVETPVYAPNRGTFTHNVGQQLNGLETEVLFETVRMMAANEDVSPEVLKKGLRRKMDVPNISAIRRADFAKAFMVLFGLINMDG